MTEEEFKKNAKTIPTNIETEEKIALDYFKYKVLPTTSGTGFESKEEHYVKVLLNLIEKYRKVYICIEETMIDYDKKHIDKDKTIEEVRKYLKEIYY